MSKVYLKVPFPEKDEVKSKGGKFESENKLWYCYSENLGLFSSKWPVYINCPFTDKEDAKSKGAMFDGDKKMWFVNPGVNLSSFTKWLPQNSIRDFAKDSNSKDSRKKEDKDSNFSPQQLSTMKNDEESSKKKQKKDKKEDSSVTQVNINVQVNTLSGVSNLSSKIAVTDSTSAELTKIKGTIKDGCSFDVATLKNLLKERGVKGTSKLSKQQLIDQCMELKLLRPVLQLQAPALPQPPAAQPAADSYEKKRKSEKDIAYF